MQLAKLRALPNSIFKKWFAQAINPAVEAAKKAFDEGEWSEMQSTTHSHLLLDENREVLAQHNSNTNSLKT